jgi:hypothetical protein
MFLAGAPSFGLAYLLTYPLLSRIRRHLRMFLWTWLMEHQWSSYPNGLTTPLPIHTNSITSPHSFGSPKLPPLMAGVPWQTHPWIQLCAILNLWGRNEQAWIDHAKRYNYFFSANELFLTPVWHRRGKMTGLRCLRISQRASYPRIPTLASATVLLLMGPALEVQLSVLHILQLITTTPQLKLLF